MPGDGPSKKKKSSSLPKLFFYTFIVIPALSVLGLRFYDYNRFIQIPYWTIFSVCYLLPEANLPMCTMDNIDAITDWTIAQWNWDLETDKPGEIKAIPEIEAKDFSYELLDKLSHGFTVPVVTRGLFADSPVSTPLPCPFPCPYPCDARPARIRVVQQQCHFVVASTRCALCAAPKRAAAARTPFPLPPRALRARLLPHPPITPH